MTEFVDELPPQRSKESHPQFFADLKANPGKWAKYPVVLANANSANNTGYRLRKLGYEAAVRGDVLYVRKPEGDAA